MVQEVENIQKAYLAQYTKNGDNALPVYEPEKFKLFCLDHGAPYL